MSDQSDSMESHSNGNIVLSAKSPSDQSETKAASVAEAALEDGEKELKLLQSVRCSNNFVFDFTVKVYSCYFNLFNRFNCCI